MRERSAPSAHNEAVGRFEQRDWLTAMGFFGVSLALRLPCRAHLAYSLDSVGFVQAVREYNFALLQPHAPGYFLYVMAARLLNLIIRGPHASLVWLSLVCGSGVSALLYLLGMSMFNRRAGTFAALCAMTSPVLWFHSCVALVYVVDAFLICLIVLIGWLAIQRSGPWKDVVALSILFSFLAGVRGQTAPAMVPCLLYAFWRFSPSRGTKFMVFGAVAAMLSTVWFASMLHLGGGWRVYRELTQLSLAFNARSTMAGGGSAAVTWNLILAAIYSWNGLVVAAPILLVAVVQNVAGSNRASRWNWWSQHQAALWMLAAWILPMVFFGTIIFFTKLPGYVLGYLPALLLLAGAVVGQIRSTILYSVVTAMLCLVNVCAFTSWPLSWNNIFPGPGHTVREIREHDEQLTLLVETIRSRYHPSDVAVCHARGYVVFGLRLFQLYLPEFDHYQLTYDPAMIHPAERPLMSARAGKLEFVKDVDFAGKRLLLLIVPETDQLNMYAIFFPLEEVHEVPGTQGLLYELPVTSNTVVHGTPPLRDQ
jgi:hypothetical protein